MICLPGACAGRFVSGGGRQVETRFAHRDPSPPGVAAVGHLVHTVGDQAPQALAFLFVGIDRNENRLAVKDDDVRKWTR